MRKVLKFEDVNWSKKYFPVRELRSHSNRKKLNALFLNNLLNDSNVSLDNKIAKATDLLAALTATTAVIGDGVRTAVPLARNIIKWVSLSTVIPKSYWDVFKHKNNLILEYPKDLPEPSDTESEWE